MKKIDLGQTIQLLANLGVIAGIILLAVELQQNNHLIRAQGIGTVLAARMNHNEEVARNADLAAILLKNDRHEELTEEELFRLQAQFSVDKMGWQKDYFLFQEGILPEDYLRANLPTMKQVFRSDGQTYSQRDHWQEWQDNAAPSYRRFIEECVLVDCDAIPR